MKDPLEFLEDLMLMLRDDSPATNVEIEEEVRNYIEQLQED
jgi:hypothetical protein